ncbi:MAG: putative transposase YbfD/YdcC, partial [Halioglobus sp.]
MGTQKDIAEKVVEKGGDYILALKGNHSTLHDEVINY